METLLSVLCTIISSIAVITASIIETGNRRRHREAEERAKRRETESKLSMELMSASVDLAYVTSLAVTGGHTNGNVELAQRKAQAAQAAYEDFIHTEAAHAVSKL